MTLSELRVALQAILEAEQAPEVDWSKVESLCRRTLARLNAEGAPDYTATSSTFSSTMPSFGRRMRNMRTSSMSGSGTGWKDRRSSRADRAVAT